MGPRVKPAGDPGEGGKGSAVMTEAAPYRHYIVWSTERPLQRRKDRGGLDVATPVWLV
jgi:hypothetical protein